jgi:hypothetical protein
LLKVNDLDLTNVEHKTAVQAITESSVINLVSIHTICTIHISNITSDPSHIPNQLHPGRFCCCDLGKINKFCLTYPRLLYNIVSFMCQSNENTNIPHPQSYPHPTLGYLLSRSCIGKIGIFLTYPRLYEGEDLQV